MMWPNQIVGRKALADERMDLNECGKESQEFVRKLTKRFDPSLQEVKADRWREPESNGLH